MKPDDLMKLATGYWPSCVLNAAVRLGVFQALDQPQTLEALSAKIPSDPLYLDRLLRTLIGLDLLLLEDDCFSIPPTLSSFLGPNAPASLEGAIRYNADLYNLWGSLDTCIQSGAPVQNPEQHLGSDPAATRRFVMGMESRGNMLAPAVVKTIPRSQGLRVLDLACGSGIFSRLLKSRQPDLEVTLFDLPDVLKVSRELWEDADAGQVTSHVGNYREDALPGPFDLILYCGALHQESEAAALALFQKVKASLAPGGQFCIIDFLLDADRTQPVFSALFSLNMMLIQPHGHVFSYDETGALLGKAGFTDIQANPIPDSAYGMVVAKTT